jgi:hypothetical protein
MLLLIDIFSVTKGRGYENPSLEIIVIECCSTGGFPLKETREHCFLNQSVIYVVVLISFMCYCRDYVGYITFIQPFLAFYFCYAYLLYMVYYILSLNNQVAQRCISSIWKKLSHQKKHPCCCAILTCRCLSMMYLRSRNHPLRFWM